MAEEVVAIRFLDHCEDGDDALEFILYGKIIGETERAYKVGTWQYVHEADRAKDTRTDNESHYIIVKAAVLSIDRYLPTQ